MLKITIIILFNLFTINSFASQMFEDGASKISKRNKRFAKEIEDQSKSSFDGQPADKRQKLVEPKKMADQSAKKQEKAARAVEYDIIYDAYTRKRGRPEMLALHCTACGSHIIDYQKDGPGRLLRCYLDRIHGPEELVEKLHKEPFNVQKGYNLACNKCPRVIGAPMIYKPEQRPAYNLMQARFYFEKK